MKFYSRVVLGLSWRWRRIRPYVISVLSLILAVFVGTPGIRFGWFALRCALRLRRCGFGDLSRALWHMPVDAIRYIEFDFASRWLPSKANVRCCDISSPRLFSVFVMHRNPSWRLTLVNPDSRDLAVTREMFACCVPGGAHVDFVSVEAEGIAIEKNALDCVWSLSVVEHIPPPGDSDAVRKMFELLKPGGKLILTVPYVSSCKDEFRPHSEYGIQFLPRNEKGEVFFQRWYDRVTLNALIAQSYSGGTILAVEYWEETDPGWFKKYIQGRLRGQVLPETWSALLAGVKYRNCGDAIKPAGEGLCCICVEKSANSGNVISGNGLHA